MTPAGLPHSEIPGSKRACRSPRLIAAGCVLHRLSVPRHPPSTLSNLTIKCLDLMRSAVESLNRIHHAFFIYNPYSIVKELPIAKIGAELGRFRLRSPLILAVCSAAWMDDNPDENRSHSGSSFDSARVARVPLVELIGIEPTT